MRNFNLKQLLITVFALLSCLSANAQYYVETGGIHYELYPDSHTASVISTNYWNAAPNGYSGDIVIPKAITYNGEGFRVTQIAGNAFGGCQNLTSIAISDNITTIGSYAFSGCTGLTELTIPNGVTTISDGAFSGCTGLANIILGSGITKIGSYVFQGCANLTSVTIPDGVITIDSYAFSGCTGLANITIGSGLTKIGSYVFQGCTGLTSATIPDGVTTIDSYAFKDCTGLTDVTVGAKVTTIGGGAFSGCLALDSIVVDAANTVYDSRDNCNAIIETATNRLVQGCNNSTIPNSVEIIGNSAFYGYAGLTDITIGDNVKTIESNAFNGCTSLVSVTLGSNVETIGDYAFCECTSLTDVISGEKVKTIGNNAFYGCTSLVSVTLGNNVETIGGYTFCNCNSLDNITLGDKVTTIGCAAFKNCKSLTSFIIPDQVKYINSETFYGCTNLTSIKIGENISGFGYYAFQECYKLKNVDINNLDNWLKIDFNSGYYNYDNPLSVGGNSEEGGVVNMLIKGNVVTDIVIPDNVEMLKSNVFGYANIIYMELHENVKTIEYNAIPSSVKRLRFKSNTPPTLKSGPAGEAHSLGNVAIVYVPTGCIPTYKNMGCWSLANTVFTDGNIKTAEVTVTPGMLGEEILNLGHISYLHEVNDLVIKGSVNSTDIDNIKYSMPNLMSIDMSGLDMSSIPEEMFKGRRALLSIILPNNVTTIGRGAFNGCSNIESIVLPEGLKTISAGYSDSNDGCFSGCASLKTVLFPSTIETIGRYAFYSCRSLQDIKFSDTVNELSIGERAFSGCSSLSYIKLPEGTTSIGQLAFEYCSSLIMVSFPKSLRTISSGAFYYCRSLREISLDGVTSIGYRYETSDSYYGESYYGAFEYCSSLVKVILNEGLVEVCQNTFRGCENLLSINIPEGVGFIGKNAFNGCRNLRNASLPSSLQRCGSTPFAGCNKLDSVVCLALLPPNLRDGVLTLEDMASTLQRKLYVPEWTLAKYKLSSGWAAFSEILPIKGSYPSSIVIAGDQILSLPKDSLPAVYKPDMKFVSYEGFDEYGMMSTLPSSLDLRGRGKLYLRNVKINNVNNVWSQLLNEEADIEADSVFVEFYLSNYNNSTNYSNNQAWYFLSFPFDVKISDIRTSCQWVIRRYDGAARADFDYNNTWKNLSYDGVLQAGEGYIWACTGGTFNLSAMDNGNKNNIFESDTVYVHLNEYISEIAADNSWNLVGNPFPCHYDTRKMDYTAPITVWNVDNSTYSAYSPVDDNYVLKPFEAFFVQKPANVDSIAFDPAGRQLSSTAAAKSGVHRVMPKVYSTTAKRSIVNLELSNGKYSDRTRFVINESAEMDYELNCDAAKFMSTETVIPQLYTVVGDVNFAINERPLNDGIVKLGTHFGEAGKYTISMQNSCEMSVVLVDLKTGVETDMNDDCYTFDAEVEDCERFIVKLYDNNATGVKDVVTDAEVVATENGIAVTASENVDIKVYNVAGRLIDERCACSETFIVAPGVYVVTVNGITYKVVVSK